ncbi:replication initiation protein [Methylobacterium sp. WL64]|uniref:replication initiation protein n=1 Tax=Methylobacterium sp. WL64 TaxID=2603894 RepID=UPI0011CADE7E|nr:replication initiation protein [Methylobacterium sp. WL64]TXM96404.1 replication initiation protein [Methylobacterium sp. WL64]
MQKDTAKLLVLDLKPRNHNEASKPAELIQVSGHHELTLNARRAITVLWHNAHMQGVTEGRDYTIEIDALKADGHKGYERVEEAVTALMRAILTVRMPNGKTRRVQFLGGNDMDDPDRPAGVLTYSFDRRLVDILKTSTIWGKIKLPVLMAFSSKYAVSLYENVAQLTGLGLKQMHQFTLDEFREMLGVMPGKYKTFGELNKHVVKPAVDEINALAAFNVYVLPVKQGKRVAAVHIHWATKDADALREAFAESERPRIGRRARITGTVEAVLPPHTSVRRLERTERLARKARSPKIS